MKCFLHLFLLNRFDVYDSDGNSSNLEHHDFIGSMECSLGEVVAHQGKGLTRHLIGLFNLLHQ